MRTCQFDEALLVQKNVLTLQVSEEEEEIMELDLHLELVDYKVVVAVIASA